MPYVTHERYASLGYSAVPQGVFPRWSAAAENKARQAILNRPFINPEDTPIAYNNFDPAYWSEQNARGICEIAEALYSENLSQGADGLPVASFSNQQYSESYVSPADVRKLTQSKTDKAIGMYFTQNQLYRGVC